MLYESKYAAKFTRLSSEGKNLFRFAGPHLLVEVLPKPEIKSRGGIVLTNNVSQKAQASDFQRALGLVLMRGEGYTDGSIMDIQVGEVVLMPYSPLYLSDFPGLAEYTQNTLAIISESDVLFSYKTLIAATAAAGLLNG